MKTIDERAKEYAPDPFLAALERKAYIAGATEQKAIDEEVRLRKCDGMTEEEYEREVAFAEWYYKNENGTPTFSDAIEWARKEVIDKTCEWLKENIDGGVHPSSTYGFVEKFKKAMELK